jgi:hypothetical protein
MLRETAELDAWAERVEPSDYEWRMVARSVFGIGRRPWRAPSMPWLPTDGGRYEARIVDVEGTSPLVQIGYRHYYDDAIVDLVVVGTLTA